MHLAFGARAIYVYIIYIYAYSMYLCTTCKELYRDAHSKNIVSDATAVYR